MTLTPLVHTFDHDLESLWWLLLYIVTVRLKNPEPSPEPEENFFPPYQPIESFVGRRISLFNFGFTTFSNFEEWFLPDLETFPIMADWFAKALGRSRSHRLAVPNKHLDQPQYASSHRDFYVWIQDMIAVDNWAGLELEPLDLRPNPVPLVEFGPEPDDSQKRKADDAEIDDTEDEASTTKKAKGRDGEPISTSSDVAGVFP